MYRRHCVGVDPQENDSTSMSFHEGDPSEIPVSGDKYPAHGSRREQECNIGGGGHSLLRGCHDGMPLGHQKPACDLPDVLV